MRTDRSRECDSCSHFKKGDTYNGGYYRPLLHVACTAGGDVFGTSWTF